MLAMRAARAVARAGLGSLRAPARGMATSEAKEFTLRNPFKVHCEFTLSKS